MRIDQVRSCAKSALNVPSRPRANAAQAATAVALLRPHAFGVNEETAVDNIFQARPGNQSRASIAQGAFAEVSAAARRLREIGIRVHMFDDVGDRDTPDSVYLNNWFSTHADGRIVLYPMHAPNRRRERRADVIEALSAEYSVSELVDLSGMEEQGQALEGTGALVLDHTAKVAYVCRSKRTHPEALAQFCDRLGYRAFVFDAFLGGKAIYHTNVLMTVATDFALVGLDLLPDVDRRHQLEHELRSTGREVIGLSAEQTGEFAGNAIELTGASGPILVLSTRALGSLTAAQRGMIERHAAIVALDLPTIERGGGSARCMIAGVHLPARDVLMGGAR